MIMGWLLLAVIVLLCVWSYRASQTDWGGPFINTIDGLCRLLCRYLHRLPPKKIPLPKTGPAIVVANHVSGLDPLLLISASTRPLRFLIAREEYERPVLHWLFKAAGCIPVDRTGRPEQALRQALRGLEQGEVIALFPHGKIHLDTDPPKRIKGGVVRLAGWSQAPVFPVRIDGVTAQGQTLLAPFVPSCVTLTMKEMLYCDSEQSVDCLQAITAAIEIPASN